MPKELENHFLVICTSDGTIKKTELTEYKNAKQSGLKAIKVVDGDSVVAVRISDGKKDILICSSGGKSIRFKEEDLRAIGRVSQGVKGMNLEDDERVIGMELIQTGVEILTITERGYGKRSEAEEYRVQSRGGKGILAMKLTEKTGNIVQIKQVNDKEDLVIITDKGQVIRTKIAGISLLGRNTQGVRLINVKPDEKVVAVEKMAESEEEIDDGNQSPVES
jgi:DNA gyrase subunit A